MYSVVSSGTIKALHYKRGNAGQGATTRNNAMLIKYQFKDA